VHPSHTYSAIPSGSGAGAPTFSLGNNAGRAVGVAAVVGVIVGSTDAVAVGVGVGDGVAVDLPAGEPASFIDCIANRNAAPTTARPVPTADSDRLRGMTSKPDDATPLFRLRRAAGLTQMQVAAGSGIPQVTYSAIERGKVKNPGSEVVQKLARFFKVSEREILGLELATEDDTVTLVGWSKLPDRVQSAVRTIVSAASTDLSEEERAVIDDFRTSRLDRLNKAGGNNEPRKRVASRAQRPRGRATGG